MTSYGKVRYVITLFLCCAALLLAGCNQTADSKSDLPEPSFAVGEPHSNALAFRLWFEAMTSTAGPCTVTIQDKIYDEEQAAEWWYAIQADLNTLNQTLSLEDDAYSPFMIYIVETALNGIQVWNDCLYCTPEDILSGAYRERLIDVSLTSEPWKQTGLIRSLFAACFVEDFAAEEEIFIAQGLAQLLCEHVITTHSGATLVEDACIDCRQELLDELGVDRTYTDPYGDFDSGCRYSSSTDYPLIVSTPRGDTFYMTPLSGLPGNTAKYGNARRGPSVPL